MQLAIIAARNRTKSFNLLHAGKVPADGKGWFYYSTVRGRFGTGFMIGLDGLNVPAQPSSEDYPKEVLRNGISASFPNVRVSVGPTTISNGTICKSSNERESDYGPEKSIGARTLFSSTSSNLALTPDSTD